MPWTTADSDEYIVQTVVNCALEATNVPPIDWSATSELSGEDIMLEQVFRAATKNLCNAFTKHVKMEISLQIEQAVERMRDINVELSSAKAH